MVQGRRADKLEARVDLLTLTMLTLDNYHSLPTILPMMHDLRELEFIHDNTARLLDSSELPSVHCLSAEMGTNIILEVTILINQLKSHLEADKFGVDNITQHVLYYNIIGDF